MDSSVLYIEIFSILGVLDMGSFYLMWVGRAALTRDTMDLYGIISS